MSLAALVALAGCAAARVPSPYPGAPVVRGVAIDGVREVGADVIRARIGTVATGRWPWDPPRRFDPVIWEEDLARIPRILESEGFFQGRVVSHEVLERRDGVVPRAVVEEGPPTVVAEVELRGLDGLPDGMRAQARAAVTLRRGERFREADWTATRSALEEVLRAGGYAEARLAAEARVHPESRAARALIEVLPGPRYRFGDLRVVTPVPPGIPQEAIVAEASSAARPGAWYDPRALAEAQARVYRMGAFSAVEVSEEAPDPRSRTVPVVIAVRAGPTRTASAGVGVGLSPHLDDVHATADWVERPSAGGLRTLRVRARAGIGAVPPFPTALSAAGSPPTRAEPFASLAADVDAPWELAASTGLHLFSSLELDLGLDEAYRSATLRPSAGVAWNPRPALQLEAQYRFSVARLFDTPLSSDPARPEVFGCATPCPISALDLLATLDTHRLSRPDSGGRRVRLRLRGAGGPLGGGYDFVQAVASLEGDRPVSPDERIRLAARLEVGTVVADGAVPVTERLAGGGLVMRGYGAGRLSPRMPAVIGGRLVAVPAGGRGLLSASLEIRRRLTSALSVVGFADAGAASVEAFDPGRLVPALTYALGGGLRVGSPLGPVRIELAWRPPIGPALPVVVAPGGAPAPPPPSGCFGVGGGSSRGGGPDSPCSLQISIGEMR